jgi:hypothetical protein
MTERRMIESPATWLSGRQQSHRSLGSTPMLKAEPTALKRKLP